MATGKIGDIGEDLARIWGTQGRFTVNHSYRDEKGWDFVFEKDAPRNGPLDLVGSHVRVMVQVKTSVGKIGRHRITLNNWIRMVSEGNMNFDYLRGHDERAVRTALVTGLGVLKSQKAGHTTFEYVAVVHEVAKALLKYSEVNEAAKVWDAYQNGFSTNPVGNEHPDNRKLRPHSGADWRGSPLPALEELFPGQSPALD